MKASDGTVGLVDLCRPLPTSEQASAACSLVGLRPPVRPQKQTASELSFEILSSAAAAQPLSLISPSSSSHSLSYCCTYQSSYFSSFTFAVVSSARVAPRRRLHGERPNSSSCGKNTEKRNSQEENDWTEIEKNLKISGNSLSLSGCLSRKRDGEQSGTTKSLQ